MFLLSPELFEFMVAHFVFVEAAARLKVVRGVDFVFSANHWCVIFDLTAALCKLAADNRILPERFLSISIMSKSVSNLF